MPLPALRPQPLVRIPEPFNDPLWLGELKLDGFRAQPDAVGAYSELRHDGGGGVAFGAIRALGPLV